MKQIMRAAFWDASRLKLKALEWYRDNPCAEYWTVVTEAVARQDRIYRRMNRARIAALKASKS